MYKLQNILLTNDDGVDALGICMLREQISNFAQVWTLAPHRNRSGCGNAMTFDESVILRQIEGQIFSLSGTPADCVNVALHSEFFPKFDLVLSGINQGENVGLDVHYSGTIAAARQAVIHGLPAIALSSLCTLKEEKIFRSAADWLLDWLQEQLNSLQKGVIYSFNFPSRVLQVSDNCQMTRLAPIAYQDHYKKVVGKNIKSVSPLSVPSDLQKHRGEREWELQLESQKKSETISSQYTGDTKNTNNLENLVKREQTDVTVLGNKQISLTKIPVLGLDLDAIAAGK